MNSNLLWRALRLGLISLVFCFTMTAAAQEVLPMAVQPSVVVDGGKRTLYLTLGNRNNLGMDTVKVTAVGGSGDAKVAELPTLNPYQWQTVTGALPNDAQAVVVEYVCNDKPQKLSVSLFPIGAGTNAVFMPMQSNAMPPLIWLGGALLLGAFVGIAGAAIGKRSSR
jgi:hypothetical protein